MNFLHCLRRSEMINCFSTKIDILKFALQYSDPDQLFPLFVTWYLSCSDSWFQKISSWVVWGFSWYLAAKWRCFHKEWVFLNCKMLKRCLGSGNSFGGAGSRRNSFWNQCCVFHKEAIRIHLFLSTFPSRHLPAQS